MNKPISVLVSDVHYNIHTLPLADAAMRMAIAKANYLNVPLIVAGDLHDTKANLRGECVNAMLETFSLCKLSPYVIVGNHCRLNERNPEHSLNFLRDEATIVDKPMKVEDRRLYLIPYHSDPDEFRYRLVRVPKGFTVIAHQGIQGSNMGDYIQDKSAILKEDVFGLRVISGHYHTRQTIDLPKGGKWDYIGNPYTLSYGEANDPEKGFQILYDDGSLEFVPTTLRKHVIANIELSKEGQKFACVNYTDKDLVWAKVSGPKEVLASVTKREVALQLGIENFKLTYHPFETASQVSVTKNLTQHELLDNIISNLANVSDECKVRLKETWKQLCE